VKHQLLMDGTLTWLVKKKLFSSTAIYRVERLSDRRINRHVVGS
jgi:hypothetical protein